MSIVSISEAARLVNKSRKTLYKHIQKGTISTVTTVDGAKGIDTSELIRVYGVLNIQKETPVTSKDSKQIYTLIDTKNKTPVTINNQNLIDLEKELVLSKLKIEQQEKELNYKQQIIDAKDNALSSKQETIDTLKSALKLLEHKQSKDELAQTVSIPPKPEQPLPEPPETVPTDTVTEAKEPATPPSSGFWSGFKNLFN